MTTPPWGHKPPPAGDVELYWQNCPPEPSERCVYWVRRLREGSWKPNRYLTQWGYYYRAGMLGVFIWESSNVIMPLASMMIHDTPSHYAIQAYNRPDQTSLYWRALSSRTRPDPWIRPDVVDTALAYWIGQSQVSPRQGQDRMQRHWDGIAAAYRKAGVTSEHLR